MIRGQKRGSAPEREPLKQISQQQVTNRRDFALLEARKGRTPESPKFFAPNLKTKIGKGKYHETL